MAMLYDELDDSEDEDEDEVPSRVTRAKPTPQLNWGKVYKARDVATYVEIVSIPPDAYDRLLTAFARHYVVTSAAGGASQLTTNHVLACLLIFYTHGATKKRLSELFGVSPALVSRILQHAEATLKKALKEIPEAKTKWPTCEQQREWAAAVQVKEPSITGCFAVAKCERFKVHKSTKREREQGWFATTQVNSVFCYGLDGTILFGELNHPIERFEDDLSSSLEDRFRNKQGGRCVVDTAFPICDPDSPEKHILRPLSTEELETAYPDELARHFAIEAIHRCPEFGVDSLTSTYRILSYALPFDPNARKIRLANLMRLYNLHIRSQRAQQLPHERKTRVRRSLTHEFDSEPTKRARMSL